MTRGGLIACDPRGTHFMCWLGVLVKCAIQGVKHTVHVLAAHYVLKRCAAIVANLHNARTCLVHLTDREQQQQQHIFTQSLLQHSAMHTTAASVGQQGTHIRAHTHACVHTHTDKRTHTHTHHTQTHMHVLAHSLTNFSALLAMLPHLSSTSLLYAGLAETGLMYAV